MKRPHRTQWTDEDAAAFEREDHDRAFGFLLACGGWTVPAALAVLLAVAGLVAWVNGGAQ